MSKGKPSALLGLILVALAGVALAQSPAFRIGYVDVRRIIDEATIFATTRDQITAEFKPRSDALKLDEARLRELEVERDRRAQTATDEEMRELRRRVDTESRNLQRRRDDLNVALNRRLNEARQRIDEQIREEIAAYARAEGFDLVLTDGVGFAHPRLDITDAVLARVNRSGSAP